jgi:hypothetical protein
VKPTALQIEISKLPIHPRLVGVDVFFDFVNLSLVFFLPCLGILVAFRVRRKKVIDEMTKRVLDANTGVVSLEGLTKDLGHLIYKKLEEWWHLSKEDASDFFVIFYPQLPKLIKNFVYTGTSFLSYLLACVKRNLIRFKIRKKAMYASVGLNYVPYEDQDEEWNFAEHPPVEEAGVMLSFSSELKRPQNRKRLHLLVLRAAWYLEDHQIAKCAELIQMDPDRLFNQIESIRQQLKNKASRKEAISNLRTRCLQRLYLIRKKIQDCVQPELKNRLKILEQHYLAKIETYKANSARISLIPSFGIIAKCLGVPRSSVGAAFSRLIKNERRRLYLKN